MEKISQLFDQNKNIYRTIEKVITYDASQKGRLKSEISEYVVTENIEKKFQKLLELMQAGMEAGGESDIGVWVSGFYGSGKSSFTKYFGLAFDENIEIDGMPFVQHLQNRLYKPQTKALLKTVTTRYPAAVVLLDLASEMLTGATMEDVSTVLYYKVLQWAGYSHNLKVATFERKLKIDGCYDEFLQTINTELGVQWSEIQNDPLVIDSLIPEIAHKMYPSLFKTPSSFSTETDDYIQFENKRVEEMLNIVREATGKQYIIFIIDEVGQYIGSRRNLILNLDGLAKNLKNIGDGKVWIMGTAQQTLTEDDPRSAINSPELYKLKDRFPIQIDLESNDIKEICYRRLLGKSPEGTTTLGMMFDKNGQLLRHNTRLQDANYYNSEFTKETFINLYPFLPAHFDILLHLLGALAKSTGGIGLRSAIKVIQDILIEGTDGHSPVAEQSIGWLATTVTIYDTLESDIRRAYPQIFYSVRKTQIRFPKSTIHQNIAKTVAVLQILGNLPVTAHNIASLMHPCIDSESLYDSIEIAIDELIRDPRVPFGEQNGNLCFFSEKVNDIEQERSSILVRSLERKRIFNGVLKEVFSPLPSASINKTLTVTSGLKCSNGLSEITNITGEKNTIQTIVEFVEKKDYETVRTELINESRSSNSKNFIHLLGRKVPEIDDKVVEIYRCQEICNLHNRDIEQEVKDYCSAQIDRATKLTSDLHHLLKTCLSGGSLIFHGQATAVDSLGPDILEASKKHLETVATQVFDRYSEAPVRVETSVAEKLLRIGNLSAVTSQIDPLGLVQSNGGIPSIREDSKALLSIRDYLGQNGKIEGRLLLEHFADAPFGWSQDTLRYLVAALLLAGEIKLNISKHDVTVNGQQAIEALKTNNSFKAVGTSLRDDRPSNEMLALAAERLTDLVGEMVVPLEDDISKITAKYLPQFQSRFAPLGEKLSTMDLPGVERINSLMTDIADILSIDASDAPQRFGSEESTIYDTLKWAQNVDLTFKQGLEDTIRNLQQHCREIKDLPDYGVPGQLRDELADEIVNLLERFGIENFYEYSTDFSTSLTNIQASTRNAAIRMSEAQKNKIREAQQDLQHMPEWHELNQAEQSNILGQLEDKNIDPPKDLTGLKKLIAQDFVISGLLNELKKKIETTVRERHRSMEELKKKNGEDGKTKLIHDLKIPSTVTSSKQLESLIQMLQKLKDELTFYSEVKITINIEE